MTCRFPRLVPARVLSLVLPLALACGSGSVTAGADTGPSDVPGAEVAPDAPGEVLLDREVADVPAADLPGDPAPAPDAIAVAGRAFH